MLDHRTAARLALKHLKDLGHKRIAFLRGQQQSSDSATRWEALEGVAKELHICVLPELVMQIEGLDSTPDLGYPYGKELIKRNVPFTAMVAHNDISAIGAMKANCGPARTCRLLVSTISPSHWKRWDGSPPRPLSA